MATLLIANDINIYGPSALLKPNDLAIEYQQYLLGNIVDMVNCPKDKLQEARDLFKHLTYIYQGAYVMGPNELWMRDYVDDIRTPTHLMIQNPGNPIILCSGHFPLWGKRKAYKWMRREAGAGVFKRLKTGVLNKWKDAFGGGISDQDIEKLYKYARTNKAKTIVCGNKHPFETQYFRHKGIMIVVLKRGFNEVDVE